MKPQRISMVLGLAVCLAVAGGSAAGALPIDFTNFHTPAQVDAILNDLQAAHPALCQVVSIGNSLEGRPIKALKISDNVAVNEPAEGDVVFIGLIHAREWITVEMALSLAEQLLNRYGTDAQVHADVDNLQIWIVPVSNPDGFAYTSTVDRFWRKNRRNNLDGTFGVDLNRNWSYQWGLDSGSSPSSSNDTYRGPSAFSEPETQRLRDFIQGLGNLKALVSYHSYSQLFLRPWSYTTADPPGEETVRQIALRSIAAIQAVHGLTYSENISYTSSGETTDFLWGEKRVAAFTTELRPALAGVGGFAPPPSAIVPDNEENLPAALALIHDAGSREVWIRDYTGDTGAEPSAVWTGTNWSHAFWVSPDIWTAPATLTQGATVTLNVHVLNDSGTTKTNVRVDAYWTDPRISLEFPSLSSHLIGTRNVSVPPGGTTVTMPWTVPTGTNSWGELHWCVGAVLMHAADMPLTTQAQRTSNVAIRNFQTEPVLAGKNLIVAATNVLDVDAELAVVIDRTSLPLGWEIVLPEPPQRERGKRPTSIERKALLLEAKGRLLQPGETVFVPVRVKPPADAKPGDSVDLNVSGALIPLLAGKREAVGNGYSFKVVFDPDEKLDETNEGPPP